MTVSALEGAELVLADGGIETRIIYEFGRAIPKFEAFSLLDDAPGREILRTIYASYADVAKRYDLPIQLGTPTWRASRHWTGDVERCNRSAVAFLREVAERAGVRASIAGVIGPSRDGYDPDAGVSDELAYQYHREQAHILASCGVDLLYAPTFPAFSELLGVARAMAETAIPYAIAPMLHPDGTLLDGTPLDEAITRIDASIVPGPRHYMIGCLYPTHAQTALAAARTRNPHAVTRVAGLKANASPLPPEQLERLGRLSAEPPERFATDLWTCARDFDLRVLGGCCGTDQHHIEAIAAQAF